MQETDPSPRPQGTFRFPCRADSFDKAVFFGYAKFVLTPKHPSPGVPVIIRTIAC
jgi:hypothetical protein